MEPLSDVDRIKADTAIPEVGDTVGVKHPLMLAGGKTGEFQHDSPDGELQVRKSQKAACWPPPTVAPCSRELNLLWLIHLTLALHLSVLLHHFLLHLLPFGLLVRCQDGIDLLRGRIMEILHLRPLIRRG